MGLIYFMYYQNDTYINNKDNVEHDANRACTTDTVQVFYKSKWQSDTHTQSHNHPETGCRRVLLQTKKKLCSVKLCSKQSNKTVISITS